MLALQVRSSSISTPRNRKFVNQTVGGDGVKSRTKNYRVALLSSPAAPGGSKQHGKMLGTGGRLEIIWLQISVSKHFMVIGVCATGRFENLLADWCLEWTFPRLRPTELEENRHVNYQTTMLPSSSLCSAVMRTNMYTNLFYLQVSQKWINNNRGLGKTDTFDTSLYNKHVNI